jgi:plasmid stabilization system protein ParE
VAQVVFHGRALADLQRIADFLALADPVSGAKTIDLVRDAISVLARHPLIGRPVEEEMRELVISRGRSGYVALYQYYELDDVVAVLAVRHQREQGYTESA